MCVCVCAMKGRDARRKKKKNKWLLIRVGVEPKIKLDMSGVWSVWRRTEKFGEKGKAAPPLYMCVQDATAFRPCAPIGLEINYGLFCVPYVVPRPDDDTHPLSYFIHFAAHLFCSCSLCFSLVHPSSASSMTPWLFALFSSPPLFFYSLLRLNTQILLIYECIVFVLFFSLFWYRDITSVTTYTSISTYIQQVALLLS
jgi:hypothetical protein